MAQLSLMYRIITVQNDVTNIFVFQFKLLVSAGAWMFYLYSLPDELYEVLPRTELPNYMHYYYIMLNVYAEMVIQTLNVKLKSSHGTAKIDID